ncbi:GNAT family N-acetyltransferase [Halomonas sp. PR-M31]|uniref:GNAT family N-acetyltransferase n=1 Tax=Halomonas sp. PR-M31 TaxID=1471202 RepID=UPI0006521C49|nr:GNAT family N-acetyltransferase [Halomonas sp. PR-M31]
MSRTVIHQGSWQQLKSAAGDIRRLVFIEEQAVPQEEEWDGRDPQCLHFLVCRDDHAIATARLLPDGHIGRVAVIKEERGQGVGEQLMGAIIAAALKRGDPEVLLDAQLQALSFYRKLGFQAFGDEFLDAGIPHRSMRLSLGERRDHF